MADTGNSATFSLSGGFTANYYQLGGTEQELPDIEDSHLGTSTKKTFIPGDLYDPGEMECELEYNPNSPPPIGTVQTGTLTYPVPSGQTNGATLSGTGYIKKRKTADLMNNELMKGTYTWKWDGKTGPTFASSS